MGSRVPGRPEGIDEPQGHGFQAAYAVIGVAVGFVLLVVPGVLVRRRYLGWKTGVARRPEIAGPLGG